MNSQPANAALHLQLTQYAEDFQELLARYNDLILRHEDLQTSHTKLTSASDILSNLSLSVDDPCRTATTAEGQCATRVLQDAASHDALTGLPNLAFFRLLADERITRAWRGGARTTLMHVVLDRVQWIKDLDGDVCADAAVLAASQRLQEQIRGCDLIARVAFDTFVVLVMGSGNEAALNAIEKRMMQALALPMLFHKKSITLSARIGRAHFPQDGIDTAALLANAETSLLQCPRVTSSEYFLHEDFTQALARQELHLAYQPHLASDHACPWPTCEAQLRWRHPLLGDLAWQDFCEQAGDKHSIVAASIWVLKTACETLEMWQTQGLRGITMVINISPTQLRSDAFTAAMVETLATTTIPPHRLELMLSSPQNLRFPGIDVNYLRELRKLGVKISICNNNEITRFKLIGDHEEVSTEAYNKRQPMLGSTFMTWALTQQDDCEALNTMRLGA